MPKYDIEDLLKDVIGICSANLNSQIDSVESEKVAKGYAASGIKHVNFSTGPDGTPIGVMEQSFNDKINNVDPCLFYGIEDIGSEGVGPATKKIYKVFVEIITVDNGNDALAKFRIFRYARALEEIFEANYDKFSQANLTKIETVRPLSFKLDLNSSDSYKVGGVSITTTLA